MLKPLVLFVLVLLWPDIVDTKNPAFLAETTVDGYTFEVILFRNHPLVAEYRKLVNVKRGDKLLFEREFIDTGGFASFYLLRHGRRINILYGNRDGFALNTLSGEIEAINLDSIPAEFDKENSGRFMFVDEPERQYRWVAKVDLPKT